LRVLAVVLVVVLTMTSTTTRRAVAVGLPWRWGAGWLRCVLPLLPPLSVPVPLAAALLWVSLLLERRHADCRPRCFHYLPRAHRRSPQPCRPASRGCGSSNRARDSGL